MGYTDAQGRRSKTMHPKPKPKPKPSLEEALASYKPGPLAGQRLRRKKAEALARKKKLEANRRRQQQLLNAGLSNSTKGHATRQAERGMARSGATKKEIERFGGR